MFRRKDSTKSQKSFSRPPIDNEPPTTGSAFPKNAPPKPPLAKRAPFVEHPTLAKHKDTIGKEVKEAKEVKSDIPVTPVPVPNIASPQIQSSPTSPNSPASPPITPALHRSRQEQSIDSESKLSTSGPYSNAVMLNFNSNKVKTTWNAQHITEALIYATLNIKPERIKEPATNTSQAPKLLGSDSKKKKPKPTKNTRVLSPFRPFLEWKERLEATQFNLQEITVLSVDPYRSGVGMANLELRVSSGTRQPVTTHVMLKTHTVGVLIVLYCEAEVIIPMNIPI
eukprot:c9272_g1_i3.p1 GENE.c9272_g1_i3~~c9272_g1_i3.p1  ORF type:complete len:300 (+),score=36.56 c9272_g1_i3:57-902(+)